MLALQTSRWKATLLLIPSLLLVGLAAALAEIAWGTASPMWAVVALVAAVGLSAVGFVVIRWWRPAVLEFHPEGLRLQTLLRTHSWPWADVISAYRVHGGQGPPRIAVQYATAPGLSRTAVLPWGWSVGPARLLAVVRAALEASRQPQQDIDRAVRTALAAPVANSGLPAAAVIMIYAPIFAGVVAMMFIRVEPRDDSVSKMRALGIERTRQIIAQCGEGYFRYYSTNRLRDALRYGDCPTGKRSGRYFDRRRLRIEAERQAAAEQR